MRVGGLGMFLPNGKKRWPRRLVTIAAFVMLAGCSAGRFGAQTYAAMSDDELCGAYGLENSLVLFPNPARLFVEQPIYARQLARTEIERRQLVPAGDWTLIEHGTVNFGMRRCSVLAAWDKPTSTSRNRVGNIEVELWKYNDERGETFKRVTFENGVLSWLSFTPT
jgi:hypothetical protein